MVKNWSDDETFWEVFEEKLFGKSRWESASKDIEDILNLINIKPDSKILDLCCGPGRHSIELAKRGFKITGVDRTEKYLETAQKLAKKEALDIKFIKKDMREFVLPLEFDVIINLFTSFGYFEDIEDDKMVLCNIYKSLKPGGVFIIEIKSKELLAKNFRESNWHEENDVMYLEERKVFEDWGKVYNRWIVIKGNEKKEYSFNLRLYSATELSRLLYEAGFNAVQHFGDFTGSPYDHNANKLVILAVKSVS